MDCMCDEKYGFLFQRARSLGFRIGEWINVRQFRERIDALIDQHEYISEDIILSIMNEVLADNAEASEIDGVQTGLLKRYAGRLSDSITATQSDDKAFASKFNAMYSQIMSLRKNDDYVVNPVQMDKFLDLINWFTRKAAEYGDKVVVEEFEPKEEHGSVTATFLMLDIRGTDEVQEFVSILSPCSIIKFDNGKDGVIVSCTVPNVFVEKK